MGLWGLRNRAAPYDTAGCRLYAIGDVHGCYALLVNLLQIIERDQAARPPVETHVVLLGDYIDRGPQSREVCELLEAMQESSYFHCLRGNHEQTMLDVLEGSRMALRFWLRYGGEDTLASWGISRRLVEHAYLSERGETALIDAVRKHVPETTVKWLRRLPSHYQHGGYLFVHAGIRPGQSLSEQEEDDLLWIREPFLSSKARHPWRVVHGHSEHSEIQMRPNRIGIDTGAYRTGVLTALGIEDQESWTLQAKAD